MREMTRGAFSIAHRFAVEARCIGLGGWRSPRPYELAWCDPRRIKYATKYYPRLAKKALKYDADLDVGAIRKCRRWFFARGNWDQQVVPVRENRLIERSFLRYSENYSWSEVGEIEWMLANIEFRGEQDGCRSLEDVWARCARLDELKRRLDSGQPLLPQRELSVSSFREKGGIGIAVGRDGDLIWMNNGAHRLGMALALGLPWVPVAILMVHLDALKTGSVYRNLRKEPPED